MTYGKRLVDAESTDDVEVRYADDTTECGDLVVAADGIHSRTREHLNTNGPEPSYTGMIGLGGYSHLPDLEPTRDDQRFVFGPARSSATASETTTRCGGSPTSHTPRRPPTTWHASGRIIDATDGPIGADPIHDLPTVTTWATGRACLAGDATHATSPSAGQGASIACEDAIVLARCLRDCPDASSAFERYEQLRRRRVEQVAAYSRKRGGTKTALPIARTFRETRMPIVLKRLAKPAAHDWLPPPHRLGPTGAGLTHRSSRSSR